MPETFGTREVGSTVQPCPLPKKPKPLHWIEIELVGEDDKAIAWEEYKILLPSGELLKGYLDGEGFARVDLIEQPGLCKIAFPSLDRDAWTFVEAKAAK